MKYVIEIEDEPFGRNDNPVIPYGMDELYKAKGFNSLVFDQSGLDKLTPLDKALSSELGEAYQRGLDDAWKAARKIVVEPENGGYTYEQLEEGFGIRSSLKILCKMTPSEVISKIKAYEEKKKADSEIKVGFEVRSNNAISDHNGIVLMLSENKNSAKLLESDGTITRVAINVLAKTGRHFPQVAELLKAMKGEQRNCHTCKHDGDSRFCDPCRHSDMWQPKGGA